MVSSLKRHLNCFDPKDKTALFFQSFVSDFFLEFLSICFDRHQSNSNKAFFSSSPEKVWEEVKSRSTQMTRNESDDQSHEMTCLHPSLERKDNVVKSVLPLDSYWDSFSSVPDGVCRSLLHCNPSKLVMVSDIGFLNTFFLECI